ncbi:MAG: helix-turn-helix domain-containing protein [Egibacteraceae bacterium]
MACRSDDTGVDRTVHSVADTLGEPVERLISLSPKTPLDAALSVKGWTTDRLARHLQIAPDTISYLRSGAHQPHPQTARVIADALGIRISDLFPDRAIPARTAFAAAIALQGFSHRQLARQAGVGLTTIESWAAGAATPRADKAESVARVLGVPVEELFTVTRRHDLPLLPTPAKTLTPEHVLTAEATGDRNWGQQAACAIGEHDRELWFPDTADQEAKARQVCAGCPVVGDCRDAFLDTPAGGVKRQEMDKGIWAGLRGSDLREAARVRSQQTQPTPTRAAARSIEKLPERRGRGGYSPLGGESRTRLERFLEAHDLSNADAARLAGIRPGSVGAWARGERTPTAQSARVLADALGVGVADLFEHVNTHPRQRSIQQVNEADGADEQPRARGLAASR